MSWLLHEAISLHPPSTFPEPPIRMAILAFYFSSSKPCPMGIFIPVSQKKKQVPGGQVACLNSHLLSRSGSSSFHFLCLGSSLLSHSLCPVQEGQDSGHGSQNHPYTRKDAGWPLHLYLSLELREGGCDSSLRLPPGGAHIAGSLGKLLY